MKDKKTGKFIKTHGMYRNTIYKSWEKMKQRCFNGNHKSYKDYGGRGITVCEEWKNSCENFYADMGEKPEGKSIDRIDNNGNYCKENCRWATSTEQNNNSRHNYLLTYNDKTQTISQWSRELKISPSVIRWRIKNGWSVKKTLKFNN